MRWPNASISLSYTSAKPSLFSSDISSLYLSKTVFGDGRSRIYGTLWILPEECKAQDVFNMEGLYLWFRHLLLIYIIIKIPQCPNCNFPMPRKSMVFAILFPEYIIKLARMSLLKVIHFKDRVISASRRSYLNRKFDSSRYFAPMNTNKIISFNMMANKVNSSIGLESHKLRK